MSLYKKKYTRQSSMVIIQAIDGRIPLVRNNYDKNTPEYKQKLPLWWKFSAGKLEKGETPINCAIREAKQETTLLLSCEDLRVLKREYTETSDHLLTIFGIIIPVKQLTEIKYPFLGSTGESIKIFTLPAIYRIGKKFHPDHIKYLQFFKRKWLILPDFQH